MQVLKSKSGKKFIVRNAASTKTVSKPVKAVIKRMVRSNQETKYYAKTLLQNTGLDGAIHTPGVDIVPLVPAVPVGDGEFERVGRQITPTKCKVDLALTFPQLNPGTAEPAPSTAYSDIIYVVIYILKSRRYKNWDDYKASSAWNQLLDDGAGNSKAFGSLVTSVGGSPFWATSTLEMQYPIEKSEYTLVKRKVVKLVKNGGNTYIGQSSLQPNLPQSCWTGSFTYKLPKLIYEDNVPSGLTASAYPTNNATMLAIGYCHGDNLSSYMANSDGSPYQSMANALTVTARAHTWYKDA